MYSVDDTVVAIATAHGGAVRGIIRVSGPEVVTCLDRCFRPDGGLSLSGIRRATNVPGSLKLARAVGELPGDMYLWPTARSFTRQPAAEFHTIGSPPLLEAALQTFCASGARLAAPGEFTLRAFLAGRLDLTQAEAVLGVIDARDGSELNLALTQLAGGLAQPLGELRDQLLELLAHLEAGLDFVEEQIEFIQTEDLLDQLSRATQRISRLAAQLTNRTQHDERVRVVLIGRPNVGKSSLFNALVEESAALVSATAGTTRDYLTANLSWGQVQLVDTAGVEASQDTGVVTCGGEGAAANMAQQRTATQLEQAHFCILCLDATQPRDEWEQARADARDDSCVVVVTKSDLRTVSPIPAGAVVTSTKTGLGVGELRRRILSVIGSSGPVWPAAVPSTAARCHDSLRLAADYLQRAVALVERQTGEELVALEVRSALEELGQVVGAVYTDDLLDRIFSRFCIGK